jgi:PAS domain S-box-containing protein
MRPGERNGRCSRTFVAVSHDPTPAAPVLTSDFLLDTLRSLPLGIIVVDETGRIVFANPLAQEIRGVGTRIGGTLDDCHPGRSLGALHKVLDRFRASPADAYHPVVVQRGSRWQVWYSRITDESGAFRGILWLAHDISQQKELQRRLLHHERLAGVGRMAAWLAHEVKNALNTIAGAVHNLRRLPPHPEPARNEMVDIIDDQVARLTDFIDRLRHLTRPLEVRPQPCDIAGLVRDTVRARAAQHPCEFELQVEGDPGIVRLDPALVERLLDNGLANAARAAGAGGLVDVTVSLDTQARGEWLQIEIADDGDGIPAEVLDHLFEPFITTSPDGTGLGLPIMREICRLHGGDLEVANRAGGGAVVTARLLSR